MTFAHPSGQVRPASARIRILGQTPPPPRRRRPNWVLLVACVVVAATGVWMTLLLRPQIGQEPSTAVPQVGSIEVMGHADLLGRRPDERATNALRLRSVDYAAAAQLASRRAQVRPVPSTPVVTAPTATGTTGTTPATPAAPAARSTPNPVSPAVVGPERPADPTSPNSALDPS